MTTRAHDCFLARRQEAQSGARLWHRPRRLLDIDRPRHLPDARTRAGLVLATVPGLVSRYPRTFPPTSGRDAIAVTALTAAISRRPSSSSSISALLPTSPTRLPLAGW